MENNLSQELLTFNSAEFGEKDINHHVYYNKQKIGLLSFSFCYPIVSYDDVISSQVVLTLGNTSYDTNIYLTDLIQFSLEYKLNFMKPIIIDILFKNNILNKNVGGVLFNMQRFIKDEEITFVHRDPNLIENGTHDYDVYHNSIIIGRLNLPKYPCGIPSVLYYPKNSDVAHAIGIDTTSIEKQLIESCLDQSKPYITNMINENIFKLNDEEILNNKGE